MRPEPHRKLTRFFIINPIKDRRLENRFESREDVDVRFEDSGLDFPAQAFDIGQYGLRLDTKRDLPMGSYVQIAFRHANDNIRCFGQLVWTAEKEEGPGFESGVAVESWHGIVHGSESWKDFRGFKPKRDRRRKPR